MLIYVLVFRKEGDAEWKLNSKPGAIKKYNWRGGNMKMKGRKPERRHIPVPERCNERSTTINKMSTKEILRLINLEDHGVARAIGKGVGTDMGVKRPVLDPVSDITTIAIRHIAKGGRLIYIGAGNSGRMGKIDACSIPSNYGVDDLVIAVIAGDPEPATRKYAQPAVDDPRAGEKALEEIGLSKKDVVIGLSISGRTAFTIGGLEYANSLGCKTACVTCDPGSPITKSVEISIEVDVGPEVITGSTRMKSATALKMITNMISTAAMVQLRYTTGNRMSHLIPKDKKRQERAIAVVMDEVGCRAERAEQILEKAHNDPRIASVMYKTRVKFDRAKEALDENRNSIQQALKWLAKQKR